MNMHSYDCCSRKSSKFKKMGDLSVLLKIVSDNSRLQLLCILQNGEHCVCEIMKHLNLSQSLISHHLKELKETEIVSDRREGKWIYYSLTNKGQQITNLIFQIKL